MSEVSSEPTSEPTRKPTSKPNDAPPLRVRIVPAGLEFAAEPTQSILEAALRAGIRLPSSCRNGTCRACLCRLASGSIRYRIEWPGLSPDEKDDGYLLPCVACAQSDVEIVAPGARRQD
ncbi:2Fe-2S iron-sulfur cluster-binding protein [Cupriavidus gilardii]|uniref:2Fe-2S iron-sulfur cluster-binding protein n=1 Tax=Cupriavidus gilardii TaxID=82541 RepID=UPI0021C0E7AF|nr:2Fe-2S iron-sulfur cluster-binding protein [Cupriavidus gilardii]MCT9126969.1 2Fe-2S iron-sulfur cluster-binding protein [Cupriavidus gilardii]